MEEDVIVTDVTEDVSSDNEHNVVLNEEVLLQTEAQENCIKTTSNSHNETGSLGRIDSTEKDTSTSDALQVKTERTGT